MAPEKSDLGRRNFLQMTGAGIVAANPGALPRRLASNPSAEFGVFSRHCVSAVAGIRCRSDDSRHHGRNPDRMGRDPLLRRGR